MTQFLALLLLLLCLLPPVPCAVNGRYLVKHRNEYHLFSVPTRCHHCAVVFTSTTTYNGSARSIDSHSLFSKSTDIFFFCFRSPVLDRLPTPPEQERERAR
ncbi:hypothetical protein F4861DRAFT_507172 [Xylaria intraflava]|nr:hypothetical protein F4861DRAFT_507172 [Xylaria intraflava]